MDEDSTEHIAGQWKPRFPAARIKKIMQADEDIGKVAQVTPVAVSRALELFMDRIIKAVTDETKARGARRVTPSHFKQIISTQKQYDFLESLTAEIPLPPSRPSTPPASSTTQPATRRRRKQSPNLVELTLTETPSKRKRRSLQKEGVPAVSATYQMKSEGKVKSERDLNSDGGAEQDREVDETGGGGRGKDWFDIVMGSNEQKVFKDEQIKGQR